MATPESSPTPSYPGDAAIRLRDNLVAMFALVVFTSLLPLPSIPGVIWMFWHSGFDSYWDVFVAVVGASFIRLKDIPETDDMVVWIDFILILLFSFNIAQASYAIRFPRKTPPRPASVPSPIHPPAPTPGSPGASQLRSSISTTPRSGSKLGPSPNVLHLSYHPVASHFIFRNADNGV